MGYWSNLRTALGGAPRPDYLASPFSDGALTEIVWSDVFGTNAAPVNRISAISIPAVAKARNLICATIAGFPLRAANADGVLLAVDQPGWTYRTGGILGPYQRMLWTLDDLLFYGQSLWAVTRGADKRILTADRIPYADWKTDAEGTILVDNEPVDPSSVIYFPGGIEGLLDKDGASLRAARDIITSVASRAKTPVPIMEIHATGGGDNGDPTTAEAKEIVAGYNKARRDPEGATVYTPSSVELRPHGDKTDSGFMVEARNAVRVEVANMTGVPAALLDGSVSAASLTYSTQEGRRNEFVDYGLSLWLNVIQDRLSADDVVPRGQRVVFDQTEFLTTLPDPLGAKEND